MYEATVSVANENAHLLDYVKEQIEPILGEVDGLTAEANEKFRTSFSLACADTYRFQIQRKLNDAVSQALTLGYKNLYMRKMLKIDSGNFYQNVLVNTICIFDNDYDKQVVSRMLNSDATLCIDGYYNFRLDSVKRKWNEITKLVSDNFYVLTDSEMITEFLQYLLESTPSKVQTLSVSFDSDSFVLYGTGEKVLEPMFSLARRATCEEEAMLNVLFFKPKNVKIYHSKQLSPEFCKMLNSLFNAEYIEVN